MTICSYAGCFLDFLLEKVELMATNPLTINLLTTSILSQLAAFPQPLLRSVLIQPDVVFQPSIRGLFTAIASLRQKLDNIMPTLSGSDEAVLLAKKFLTDRVDNKHSSVNRSKAAVLKESANSVVSTISQIGMLYRGFRKYRIRK